MPQRTYFIKRLMLGSMALVLAATMQPSAGWAVAYRPVNGGPATKAATSHGGQVGAAADASRKTTTRTSTTRKTTTTTTTMPACGLDKAVTSVAFVINGVTQPTLFGRVPQGARVSVVFTIAAGCVVLADLVSSTAPSGTFVPGIGPLEHHFDEQSAVVGAGTHTLGPISIPDCFFEVDFKVKPNPGRGGQKFRVSSANGGTAPCSFGTTTTTSTAAPTTTSTTASIPRVAAATTGTQAVDTALNGSALALTGPRDVGPSLSLGFFLTILGVSLVSLTRRRPQVLADDGPGVEGGAE
jgi:hypothetical protein